MSTRTIHVGLSVDVDRFGDKYILDTYGEMFAANGVDGIESIRAACANMRAKGFAVFPPCDNTKADGRCAGHPTREPLPKVVTTPCNACDLCVPTNADELCAMCAPCTEFDVSEVECVLCGEGVEDLQVDDDGPSTCQACGKVGMFISLDDFYDAYLAVLDAQLRAQQAVEAAERGRREVRALLTDGRNS